MRTMRLLEVSTVSVTLQSFLLPFAAHFKSKGWKVDAAAAGVSDNPSCVAAFDTCYDLKFSREPLRNNIPELSKAIRKLIDENQYDLVHVHTPIAAFIVRFALRKHTLRPRVIYTAHGFHFGYDSRTVWTSPYFYFEKIAGWWTDALVVINHVDYDLGRSYRLVPENKLFYTPGIGIDLQTYSTRLVNPGARDRLRQEMGIENEDFLILMIAEFNPRKRHIDILHALKQLSDSRVHVAFAGSGPLLEEVKIAAKDLSLQKYSHFLGFRRDVCDLIAAADAAALLSNQEGLPRSIMECMAMGVPVIGTKIRGTSELLDSGCGVLVEVGNVEAIAEGIRSLQGEGRHELIRNATRKITSYSLDNVLAEYDRIFSVVTI